MSSLQKVFYGKCSHCDGEGQRKIVVDGEKILMITVQHMDNKINAIKAVRTAYNILGLRDAKELVEHSIDYVTNIRSSLRSIELSNKTF